jgi:hypothetical protein
MQPEDRCAAVFVMTNLVKNYPEAQEAALKENTITLCLSQINDPHSFLRLWMTLCLGHLWMNHSASRWCGVRNNAHEKLIDLMTDPVPEVRYFDCFPIFLYFLPFKKRNYYLTANVFSGACSGCFCPRNVHWQHSVEGSNGAREHPGPFDCNLVVEHCWERRKPSRPKSKCQTFTALSTALLLYHAYEPRSIFFITILVTILITVSLILCPAVLFAYK